MKKRRVVGDSELLGLLNSNKAWSLPLWRQPKWNGKDLERIREAAKVHGQAYPADPYAEARMRLYLMRGMDDITAVNVAATRMIRRT